MRNGCYSMPALTTHAKRHDRIVHGFFGRDYRAFRHNCTSSIGRNPQIATVSLLSASDG